MRTIASLCLLALVARAGDAEFQRRVEQECARISGKLEAWLGPKFRAPVPVDVKTKDEIAAFARELAREETPSGMVEVYQALAERLRLVPPGYDLLEKNIEMVRNSVAGLYDADTDRFFVVEGRGSPGTLIFMITAAHELVHAYRDVDKDFWPRVKALMFVDADWAQGVRFLVEGDATFLGSVVGPAVLMKRKPEAFLPVMRQQADNRDLLLRAALASPQVAEFPLVLKETLVAAYVDGLVFAAAIYDQGGLEALDAAYDRPPRSTEQVLHPEKYLGPDVDEPTVFYGGNPTPALGRGWSLAYSDAMGELDVRILFTEALGRPRATETAAGWDGARYWFCRKEGRPSFLGLISTWDTPRDALEFARAWSAWAGARDGAAPRVEGAGTATARVETRDGLVVIALAGNDVLVADGVPPDRADAVFAAMSGASRAERSASATPWPAAERAWSPPFLDALLALGLLTALAGGLLSRRTRAARPVC